MSSNSNASSPGQLIVNLRVTRPVQVETTEVITNHTHWFCNNIRPNGGGLCLGHIGMDKRQCISCGCLRRPRALAMSDKGSILGSLASINAKGEEVWQYRALINGASVIDAINGHSSRPSHSSQSSGPYQSSQLDQSSQAE
ncbi:hypothetical protein NW762_006303 [Fusarium torreyae]|uniref:Uncharacterized protein n=1 Tax=Fusarium torreyae TaxID=1237075 RepID=A0A9W8S189_9HYPO|nr:hypothetical protein NW762_006303 [Fusarium torreyae]